jgi:hypothetical protein
VKEFGSSLCGEKTWPKLKFWGFPCPADFHGQSSILVDHFPVPLILVAVVSLNLVLLAPICASGLISVS